MQNNYLKNVVLVSLLLVHGMIALAQDTIRLRNPSFEAQQPQVNAVPGCWMNMGLYSETLPDIQPGQFGVNLPAQDGKTYVGLVVRDNNTWQGLGQGLYSFLQKDSVYSFSIYLAHLEGLKSAPRLSTGPVYSSAPTLLKIWGYNTLTKQQELLAQSANINHAAWQKYTFTLRPTLNRFDEINLTAYYAPGFEQKNGNLLMDNCSTIVKLRQ